MAFFCHTYGFLDVSRISAVSQHFDLRGFSRFAIEKGPSVPLCCCAVCSTPLVCQAVSLSLSVPLSLRSLLPSWLLSHFQAFPLSDLCCPSWLLSHLQVCSSLSPLSAAVMAFESSPSIGRRRCTRCRGRAGAASPGPPTARPLPAYRSESRATLDSSGSPRSRWVARPPAGDIGAEVY